MILTISFESVKNKQYKIVALTLKQKKHLMTEKTPLLEKRGGVLFLYRYQLEITAPAIVHI
jgi:hypothetical protein